MKLRLPLFSPFIEKDALKHRLFRKVLRVQVSDTTMLVKGLMLSPKTILPLLLLPSFAGEVAYHPFLRF